MATKPRTARPFAVNDNGHTIKVFSPKDPELMLPSEIKAIEDAIVAQVTDLEELDGPVRIEWCDGVPDYLEMAEPVGTA